MRGPQEPILRAFFMPFSFACPLSNRGEAAYPEIRNCQLILVKKNFWIPNGILYLY